MIVSTSAQYYLCFILSSVEVAFLVIELLLELSHYNMSRGFYTNGGNTQSPPLRVSGDT